jgi:succinate dehydrogenase / fumarate reductase cytochrome b subunit
VPDKSDSFLVRHEFLVRRLHSLSGLVPVGAYLVIHLLTNASVLDGADSFQANVDRIHSLGAILPVVEWTFIFIPILFHAIIGFVIIQGGLPNTRSYPYMTNVGYTLQRATGMIAFVFILFHVLQLHWLGEPLQRVNPDLFGQFSAEAATSTTATALSGFVIQGFYLIGVLASVYHLAYGLWTMGITWGAWTSPPAQKRARNVCAVFGVLLAMVGVGALYGFMNVDIDEAKAVEERLEIHRKLKHGELVELRDAARPGESEGSQD